MYFSFDVINAIKAIPISSAWTSPPASTAAPIVSVKPEKNKKNIETSKTTKVDGGDGGDGVCKSNGSGLIPNDATERENSKSEGTSGSLNNAVITDEFHGYALAQKEIFQVETKEIVKLAVEPDETGNIGFEFDDGAEATFENSGSLNNAAIADPVLKDAKAKNAIANKAGDSKLNDCKTEVANVASEGFNTPDNAGLGFDKGTDANRSTLRDMMKSNIGEVVKSTFELDDTAGNTELKFDESADAMLGDMAMEIGEVTKAASELDDTVTVKDGFVIDDGTLKASSVSPSTSPRKIFESIIINKNDDASHGTFVEGGKVMPEEMKQGGFALFSEKMMELVIGNVNDLEDKRSGEANTIPHFSGGSESFHVEEFNGIRADGSDKDVGKGGLMCFGPDCTMFEDTARKLHCKTSGSNGTSGFGKDFFSITIACSILELILVWAVRNTIMFENLWLSLIFCTILVLLGLLVFTFSFESSSYNPTKVTASDTSEFKKNNCSMLVSPWKKLFFILLLCASIPAILADPTSNLQTQETDDHNRPFRLDRDMKQLQAKTQSLRGGEGGTDSVGIIELVTNFMRSFSKGIGTIKDGIDSGDSAEAAKALKAVVGDVNSVTKSSKEMKQIQGMDKLPDMFSDQGLSDNTEDFKLEDVPDAILGEHIQPEIFDRLAKFSNEFLETLEGIDISSFKTTTKKKTNLHSSSRRKSKPTTHDKEHSNFDFGSGPQFDPSTFFKMNSAYFSGANGDTVNVFSNFIKHPSMKSIQKQIKIQRKGFKLPKLSTFVSLHDHEAVMIKHQVRQEAIGDVCLPECDVSDAECNCNKLFTCAEAMDEYDLAVLTAKGFIDTTVGSDNYGDFSVSSENLNLFTYDQGVGIRLQDIKSQVQNSDSSNPEECKAILQQFHTACDPNEESCSKANQQSFQAIGDEFDGFAEEGYTPQTSYPLSYTACQEFATQFDRVYQLRDGTIFTHPNPMLRDSDSVLFFSDARVRKVKLQHDDNWNERMSLGEIEVYNESGVNQALSKPATQSSTNGNYYASNGVDGNTGTTSLTEKDSGAWWEVDLEEDVAVSKVVVHNRYTTNEDWLIKLSYTTVSLLDENDNVIGAYRIDDARDIDKIEIDITDFHVESFFDQIQFPLAYNFPQDETGLVDRSFEQDAFNGGSNATLTSKKFSIIDPETNMALSVADCGEGTLMLKEFDSSSDQQFRITDSDQLESIHCQEEGAKVVSVALVETTWMCENSNDEDQGVVTISGSDEDSAIEACTNSRDGCSNDDSCQATFISNDYCVDGNKLILEDSNLDDSSQKWRFYNDGIVNVACGRESGNLAITQIDDDIFDDVTLLDELHFSFVNPSTGQAIGVGAEIACFESKDVLQEAVISCASQSIQNSAECEAVKATHGWPMNNWCFEDTVTDMSDLFDETSTFNEDISGWDVSRVTNMAGLFRNAEDFNQDISTWDVSKVENMRGMFNFATSFNQNISSWNVDRVTRMDSMFRDATSFSQSLNSWNVDRVTIMNEMFRGATSFNQSLNSWNVDRVTRMDFMFYDATSFNQDISGWNVSRVETMQGMFAYAGNFNQNINSWETERVTMMASMFYGATSFNQDLSGWDVSHVQYMQGMFYSATSFNQDISRWDISSATNMRLMFGYATSFNQDLCAWRSDFQYNNADNIFTGSGCVNTGEPDLSTKRPFCKSLCFFDADIGSNSGGSSTLTDGNIEITGSGDDIWERSDSFHYYYKYEAVSIDDDIEIEMKVESFEGDVHHWAKGGLMLRDSLAANSKHFSIYSAIITAGDTNDGVSNQYRSSTGGGSTNSDTERPVSNSIWLKITKTGSTFQAYYSTDNDDDWTSLGQSKLISFSDTFYYGIAVCSHNKDGDATLTVSDFTFQYTDDSSKRVQETKHLPSTLTIQHEADFTDTPFTSNIWSQRELEVKVNDNALTGNAFLQREPEVKVNDNASTTAAKTPDLKNRKNARALTKESVKSNSFFLDMEVYDGSHSQLFNIRRVKDSDGNIVVGEFKIFSVQYPDMLLSLSDHSCHDNTDIVLWEDQDDDYTSTWKITGGTVENAHCEGIVIDISSYEDGGRIQSMEKNSEWGQKWNVKSAEVVLAEISTSDTSQPNANQTWTPRFVEVGYDLGIHPGFPGTVDACDDGEECLSSVHDGDLSKEAMHICDESMSFLVGSQLSVGTLKSIADSLENDGLDRMPGYCCMDVSTNSEFFGYNFDPMVNDTDDSPMECQNKGLWHLGISDEACENAGGQWHRTACVTLQETIDGRPSRFDLDNPMDGSCQDNFDRLETAFVLASTDHDDFPFEATLDGCHEFCRVLPDYARQIGMALTSSSEEINSCTCLYQNGTLPSRELMPSYATPSPPKFTLTNSDGMALGLRPNIDCNDDDLTVETQVSDPNNPRQQFQITQDGRIVSVRCPEKVLTTVLGSGGSCVAGVGLQILDSGHIPSSQCFATQKDLQSAVNACASPNHQNGNTCEAVKATYGWPMNNWCFGDTLTDMSELFVDKADFNEDISEWDVSSVTSMAGLFKNAASFNRDISEWDVSRVENMEGMFKSATSFNRDIGGWDVSRVENMADMFNSATSFNQDISGWDVSRVTSMAVLFRNAQDFNQDISAWDVSEVTNMWGMFKFATSFNQNINSWETERVTMMASMFYGATSFNQNIGNWDTGKVTSMNSMFYDATSFNQNIENWNIASVTDMTSVFKGASNFNQDLCAWRGDFQYNNADDIFTGSGCVNTGEPDLSTKSPFCKSLCFSDIDINLNSNSAEGGSSVTDDGKIEITGSGSGNGSSNSFIRTLTQSRDGDTTDSSSSENTPTKKESEERKSDNNESATAVKTSPEKKHGIQDRRKWQSDAKPIFLDDRQSFEHVTNHDNQEPKLTVNNDSFYYGSASDLQRWAFNPDGSISNVGCSNLAIYSSKEKDVSLYSTYFALQNPRTQLAIGIPANSCTNYSVRKVRVNHQTKTVVSIAEMQVYDGSRDDESNSINKALNKPAQQSSTVDGFPALNAVDGDVTTFSHTDNAGAWWEVDLEEDVSVTKVIVYNRNNYQDRLSDATVSLLDSNNYVIGTYKFGDTSNIDSIEIDITDFTFTNSVRKVRVQHDSSSTKLLSMGEVVVYDGSLDNELSSINVALNKPATQSSDHEYNHLYPASNGVDGDIDTWLTSQDNTEDIGAWWKVDLEEDISVTKVIVYNRQDCCKDRLSDATVSLLDENDNVIGTYQIGDASSIASIEIDISEFTFSTTPNGLTLETQELAYGSPNQQFIYVEEENKIVSLMCPDFAITIPDGDCATLEGLYLSSESYSDNRNKWDFTYFDGNDIIQSLECQDKFITISGASGGQAKTVLSSSEKLSEKSSRNRLGLLTAVQSQAQKSKTQTVMMTQQSIAQVRKVKVQHDETLGEKILNIGEILVYDESDENDNKVLNKPATQSSTFNDSWSYASKAVDGDIATSSITESESGAWWQVDLEYDVTVSKVVVYNRQNCCQNRLTNAIISLLDDGDNVIGTYQIGDEIEDESNDYMVEISASDFQVQSSSQTESSLPESSTYDDSEESTTASYSNTVQTQTAVWDGTTYPSSGSTIVLSDFSVERFQKWTKQRQLFHPLMGPFSIVNPHSGLALAVEDGTCANGMVLNSETDDHTSSRQMFYLGQHGSIFSAQCPGLVIAADSSSDSSAIKLEIFQHNEEKLKWKFTNGMVESALYPGMVLANNDDSTMILQSTDSNFDSSMNWIRTNTRLLDLDDQSGQWKQEWTVSFISSDYENVNLEDFIQDDTNLETTCYDMSSAFSPSFDDFAKELVIEDSSDEDQCRNVREKMGFDKDHPFDTEVRDSFYEHQCDPFFTGVDHVSKHDLEALAAAPQFEMVDYTPVEYEAVEYEEAEYITVDYEEFAEGDNLGDLTEAPWPDLYIPEAGLGDLTGIFSDDEPAKNQDNLPTLFSVQLALNHGLVTAQHIWDLTSDNLNDVCKEIGDFSTCHGAGLAILCVVNVPRYICSITKLMGKKISYYLLVAATIAFQAADDVLSKATMGPDAEYYNYYYSRANYHNTKHYNEWNEQALNTIRLNMRDQHTEMKRQLQERHRDIANHVGQDIADTQNALGQAIVDAQNDIGQGIVDAQNALGQEIVDSQNALGQAIVDSQNYITLQHNELGEWLHTNLCLIYEASGGSCDPAIGPLREDQAYIPMQLHWPDGQLNMMEKIEQLQTSLPVAAQDNLLLDDSKNANVLSAGGLEMIKDTVDALSSDMQHVQDNVETVKGKVDDLSSKMQDKVDDLSSKMQDKVDDLSSKMQDKVDALSSDVRGMQDRQDTIQDELKELKDMMTKLMGMMAN